MISRRQLIGSGVAVSVLGFGGRVSAAPAFATAPVTHLIVDTRFDNAREFARPFMRPGLRMIALPRDVLELWHDHLAPSLKIAPQHIAGVTTEHAFFTLRTLAADHRLRVLHSAVHAGSLHAWVIGPALPRV